jgi:ATPase subunit of ABC transporter with duplicated ATPase domains
VPAPAHSVLTFSAVGLKWPDGTVAFDGLDLLVAPGRSGLVGANGSGKSTLLTLAAGLLRPTTGSVSVGGEVGYLPQDLVLDRSRRVDDVLGIGAALRALRALDAGSGDPAQIEADLEAVGDQWDVEERAVAELARLGLPASVLDRRLGELSGGEAVRLGLARLLLRRPDVLLLDEPTNNLDAAARSRLYDVLGSWPRTLLVVSHDRELLERVERIGELRDGAVRWYGGGFSSYAEQVAAEQAAAEQAVTAARSDVRRQQADRVEAERLVAQRKRQGERNAVRTNMARRPATTTRTGRRSRPRPTARSTTSASTRPAAGSRRPRPGCVRTAPSASTCLRPRCRVAASCSRPTTW